MVKTWADKHAPQTLSEIKGHSTTVKKIKKWVETWEEGKKEKPILLHGPPGSGKTAIVQAIKKQYEWELLELNASDTRNKDKIERIAGNASTSTTLSGKKRIILLDEVDGLFRKDHGGTRAINKVIKETEVPIILTANDAYDKKLRTIRNKCQLIQVKKVHPSTIAKLLKKIAETEEVQANKETLKQIAKSSQGDVRGAINDLQALAEGRNELKEKQINLIGQRKKKEKIFKAMEKILKEKGFQEARKAINELEENPDFTLKWIDENLPKQYEKPEDLYNGLEKLSKADIYLGRTYRRQNYGLWRYANVLMGPGVSLAKEKPYHGYTRYSFPSLIRKLGSSKKERNIRESIGEKIGEKCHVSIKTAINDYIPLFNQMMKEKETRIRLTAEFQFTEDELKFLGVSQRKHTLKKAKELREKNIAQKINKNTGNFKDPEQHSEPNKNEETSQRSLNHF